MTLPTGEHPDAEQLRAFGVGKLDPTTSKTVVQHLETCADCMRLVAESSSDTFLHRLRGAQSGIPSVDRTAPYIPASHEIPPELANNPEYEDLVELGRGGMGVVYKARNTLMGRDEVLKVMNKEMMSRPGAIDRFKREVQSAARLDHPNIVRAYSARLLGELLVFSMEFVPGDELGKLVRARGALPIAHACFYAQQVAHGLQHAHEKGMVHRDIKPANLILRVEGKKHTIKILDFGLAKLTSERGFDAGLTGEGRMLGTPDYIAPEQIVDAQSAGIRADIYSLGCTLYYLLTGRPPFRGASLYELLKKHQEAEPEPLTALLPELPPELAGIVAKMMAKDPGKRYRAPAEVAKALAPFIKPGASRPKGQTQLAVPLVEPLPEAQRPTRNMWETLAVDSIAGPGQAKARKRKQGMPAWIVLSSIVLLGLAVTAALWAGGVFKGKAADAVVKVEPDPERSPPKERKLDPTSKQTIKDDKPMALPFGKDAPDLRKAKVLFNDDFDDRKSGFENVASRDGWYEGYGAGGVYVIDHPKRRMARAHRIIEQSWGECAYEVRARLKGGPNDSWTFQINNFNQKLGCAVLVRNSGIISVYPGGVDAVPDGFQGPRVDPFLHTALHKDGDWNTLLVIHRKGSIELFVNGSVTGKPIEVDPKFDPNRIQFVLSTQDAGSVEIDRLTIYSIEGLAKGVDRLEQDPPGEVKRLTGHTAGVYCVAFLPDGLRAVSASIDNTIRLWNLETGKEIRSFLRHGDEVLWVTPSSDGKRLLSGSRDQTVRLWNTDTDETISTLTGHTSPVFTVLFANEGHRAYSCSLDQMIWEWDLETGRRYGSSIGIAASCAC